MGSVIKLITGEYLGRRDSEPSGEENFEAMGLLWIPENHTSGFLKPVWDFGNGVFIEGASLEELEAKKQDRIRETRAAQLSLSID